MLMLSEPNTWMNMHKPMWSSDWSEYTLELSYSYMCQKKEYSLMIYSMHGVDIGYQLQYASFFCMYFNPSLICWRVCPYFHNITECFGAFYSKFDIETKSLFHGLARYYVEDANKRPVWISKWIFLDSCLVCYGNMSSACLNLQVHCNQHIVLIELILISWKQCMSPI